MSDTPKRFTYNGDPAASPVAAVRFLLGDTNSCRVLLDDREIEYALERQGSDLQAAILLGTALATRFASMADVKIGPISKSYSRVAEMLCKQVEELKDQACLSIEPAFLATTYEGRQRLYEDCDTIYPCFYKGMGDHGYGSRYSRFHEGLHRELLGAGFNGW